MLGTVRTIMARHNHFHDNSTHINFPATIKVHEHKAPTDESIRLMEEMHDKAMKNIIAKVKVEDNLVKGECFCIEQPWSMNDVILIFKFSINGKEFTIERGISRFDIGLDEQGNLSELLARLESHAKAVMLWYALKMFTATVYEQLTGTKAPEFLVR